MLIVGYGAFANRFTAFSLVALPKSAANLEEFTGKERGSESGLDYFGARYYGSALGKFTSPDWAEVPTAVPYAQFDNPQSLNLYTYVLNNPLKDFDDDGHTHQVCGPDTFDQKADAVTAHCHDEPDWWNVWTNFQNWRQKQADDWNKRIADVKQRTPAPPPNKGITAEDIMVAAEFQLPSRRRSSDQRFAG
jgi:RHS repeat-associated protein